MKQSISDLCGVCHESKETIQCIITGCFKLALTDYTCKHNQIEKIFFQLLTKSYGLFTSFCPYYKFEPLLVLKNRTVMLYWCVSVGRLAGMSKMSDLDFRCLTHSPQMSYRNSIDLRGGGGRSQGCLCSSQLTFIPIKS